MKNKKRLSHYFIVPAIIIILITVSGFAMAKKPRVAILGITAKNTAVTYGAVVEDILEVAIYKTGKFDLLERNKVSSILKEQGFQASGCTDESCAVELGKLLSAEMVIIGSIIKLGKFTITIKLLDMKEGRVVVADSEVAEAETDIQSAVDKLAERISEKMKDAVESRKGEAEAEEEVQEEAKGPTLLGAFFSRPYSLKMTIPIAAAAVFFGTGYYFDTQVASKKDSINSLQKKYDASTDPYDITDYKNDMKSEKDDADKFSLYRNISYGLGGASLLVSAFYVYRFFTYTPSAVTVDYKDDSVVTVYPIMSAFNFLNNYKRNETFYGCGINYNF